MSGFVLDASVALAWCFSDEATPNTNSLLDRLQTEQAFVPSLWYLEVGNILVMAERSKRISFAKITEFVQLLDNLNINVDSETAKCGFNTILSLAYSEKLTTYDASYLELAIRLGKPLATKDHQLRVVAKHLGVKLL